MHASAVNIPENIEAIYFDLDGTLVDSRLDFRRIREELRFPQGIGLIEHIATLPESAAMEAWAVIDRHELEGAHAATWIPGAQSLLATLAQSAVATGILTRNSRKAVSVMQQKLGIDVPLILCREDCAEKPNPEGLLMLAERHQREPSRCLYVGDFVYDLHAARHAGMVSVLLANSKNERFRAEADLCIDHLEQLADLIEAVQA